MLKLLFFTLGIAALVYWRRHGFRRAWYILRTGDENPDWKKLDAEYFSGRKKSGK